MKLLSLLVGSAGALFVSSAMAAPTCHVHSTGTNYCQYSGKISKVYVNKQGSILVYLAEPFTTDVLSSAPQLASQVTAHAAVMVRYGENPQFSEFFYSTVLAAQAQKKTVSLQMYGAQSGYLQADRVWLNSD